MHPFYILYILQQALLAVLQSVGRSYSVTVLQRSGQAKPTNLKQQFAED